MYHIMHKSKYSLKVRTWNESSNTTLEVYIIFYWKMLIPQKTASFLPSLLPPSLPPSFLPRLHYIPWCECTTIYPAILILMDYQSSFSSLPLSTMLQIKNCTYTVKHWWFQICMMDFEKQTAGSKNTYILILTDVTRMF